MINTEKAAEQLGTSQFHIRRLAARGDLVAEKQDDGSWQIEARSVTAYKHERRSVGRPLNSVSSTPANIKQYGEGTPEAQARREYLRIRQRESRARRKQGV